jgi:hypothetical protein
MKNKLLSVKEAKDLILKLENKTDILDSVSKSSDSITVAREIQAMKSIIKDKADEFLLPSIFSKSFLEMKKVYRL